MENIERLEAMTNDELKSQYEQNLSQISSCNVNMTLIEFKEHLTVDDHNDLHFLYTRKRHLERENEDIAKLLKI